MPKKTVAAKKNAAPKKVESIRHKDKRANIPTEELRDFVADDELAPKTMLYPRDPSLDPQLVWKGKDEQDREDLAVPVVPIYIQEKIHPQAIIEALPRMEQPADEQTNLFADFNGGPKNFEQKVDFHTLQVCFAAVDGLQSAVAVRYIGRGHGDGVGQALRIDRDVTLDAGDLLARIVALLFGAIGVKAMPENRK